MDTLDKNDLALERTEFAEDRTIMANERTFAGWMRTGMTAVAIGIGFQALLRDVEPTWIPKTAASFFCGISIVIFLNAYNASRKVLRRLHAHEAEPTSRRHMAFVCGALSIGSLFVAVVLWMV